MRVLSLLLCVLVSLLSVRVTCGAPPIQPPPVPVAPWGPQPSSRIWPNIGTQLAAGSNPLNGAGTSATACSIASVRSEYYFSVRENYQQQVTFAPPACTNVVVQLTSVPDGTRGIVYAFSMTAGRGFPITPAMLPLNLTGTSLLFQPALNDFSVYDDQSLGVPLTPPRNSSMASIAFTMFNSNVTAATKRVSSRVEMWVLWQNQAPLTPPMQLDLSTMQSTYDNQILNLTVHDSDMRAGIQQIVSAYIQTLPSGPDCVGAQLYQYDASAPLYRGAAITAPNTPVLDPYPSFRVVMRMAGTGRPYCTFNYTADDYFVDSSPSGTVTVNIFVEEVPVGRDLNVTLDQLAAGTVPGAEYRFQLPEAPLVGGEDASSSSNATNSLNRAILTSLPLRGSVYQVLSDGRRGQRVSSVPSNVTDPSRAVWFLPDPYSTSDPSGSLYAQFDFLLDNGVARSTNASTVRVFVTSIHLPPSADPVPVVSLSGSDVAVSFRASSRQPGVRAQDLLVQVTSFPALGSLKQNDASGTVMNNVTCPLPCNVTVPAGGGSGGAAEVNYSPAQNALDPSLNRRYTESFSYRVFDGVAFSPPALVTVQVGSRVRPPLVFNASYSTTQDASQLLIQLNGTQQDDGDSWGALITRLPTEGALYQMVAGSRGPRIELPLGPGGVPGVAVVTDANFYVYFVPNRFGSPAVSFEFEGVNSDGMYSPSRATVSILVAPVGYAPRVVAKTETTAASQALRVHLPYSAGPEPTPPTEVFITELPSLAAAGSFYQFNSTSGMRGVRISQEDVLRAQNTSAASAAPLPGLRVTDPDHWILYDPPPYMHGPPLLGSLFTKFSYTARSLTVDGFLLSPGPLPGTLGATVNLAVTRVNFPPSVRDASVTTAQGVPVTIALGEYVFNPSASIAGDSNTFRCKIASLPPKGILYQVDGNGRASTQILAPDAERDSYVADPLCRVIYRARSDRTFGSPYDSFRFFAVDPLHISEELPSQATLTLNVSFVNRPPEPLAQSAYMYENQARVIQLQCEDAEGHNCSSAAGGALYITEVNLPRGQLFQFVERGGGVPSYLRPPATPKALAMGGLPNDPEWWVLTGNTPANYTGVYGGGFDRTHNAGKPITPSSLPVQVSDPLNRVLFAPLEYDHGYVVSSDDWIYGNPFLPGNQGTFAFIANDGSLNSTSAGRVSVRVVGVPYDPLAHSQRVSVAEDGFVVIPLPVHAFGEDEVPMCYIMTLPSKGALFQYDARTPLNPKAEQILSQQTHVQDFNADGTPGSGCTVVYEPPKLRHGEAFTNFTFRAETSTLHKSAIATITVDVSKTNHAPIVPSFSVVLSGHNNTVPVTFNVTELDYQAVYLNVTGFPSKGGLWSKGAFQYDSSPSGFHTWKPTPGSFLSPHGATTFYPPVPYYNASNLTTTQYFSVLFDDLSMGGQAVPTGCLVEGADGRSTGVSCGYTNFTYRVVDVEGAYAEGFVQIIIQCGPAYVVNTWQTIGGACVMCPTGAICPIEGQFTPLAQPGYWRGQTPTGLMFVQCDPPSACLGTWNQSALASDLDMQCAHGYHGRLCAACDDRFYKLNNECKACPVTSVFWLVLGGVPLAIFLMFIVLHMSRRGIDLTFFSIVLTYCQVLAVYAQYHLTWPTEVMTTLTVFSITHLNLDIFAVSCYYNTGDYSDKWAAKMLVVPGLALAVTVMIALLALMRTCCGRTLDRLDFGARRRSGAAQGPKGLGADPAEAQQHDAAAGHGGALSLPKLSSGLSNYARGQQEAQAKSDLAAQQDLRVLHNNDPSAGFDSSTPLLVWRRYYFSLGVRTFTLLLFVAYLPICTKAFQAFNCTSFPDGSWTFDADPSLTCYTPWWDRLQPWAVLAVMGYGIGIPAWFIYALKKTHPPFVWQQYWKFIYYPRIKTAVDTMLDKSEAILAEGALPGAEGAATTPAAAATAPPSKGAKNLPPPPPPAPPAVPAPSLDSAGDKAANPLLSSSSNGSNGSGGGKNDDSPPAPHLHAATVKVLAQAEKAPHAVDDSSERKEEELAEQREALEQAAWSKSTNLALTNAASSTLTQDAKIARFMFTLVIDPFRDALFYWMLVVLFRSFLLAMVSIFFADEPVYQATLALLVLFLYTLATAFFQPYVNPSMNRLEFKTMTCACLVLFCGFLFVGEPDKQATVFHLLSGLCLIVILVSLVAIGRVVGHKLEEAFHCWNCRKVPHVQAPPAHEIDQIARDLRQEIRGGHAQARSHTAQPKQQRIHDDNGTAHSDRKASANKAAASAAAILSPASKQQPASGASSARSVAAAPAASNEPTHFKFVSADPPAERSAEAASAIEMTVAAAAAPAPVPAPTPAAASSPAAP